MRQDTSIIDEYKSIHQSSVKIKMVGEQIMFHIWDIQDFTNVHPATTMLDFGCGKAYAYFTRKIDRLLNVHKIIFYDIGIEQFSKKPKEEDFSSVVSVDVLEHIPEEEIADTFKYWYSENTEFVFATIAAYPAKHTFSNGENVHVNQNSWAWWSALIDRYITCHSKFVFMPSQDSSTWRTYEIDI